MGPEGAEEVMKSMSVSVDFGNGQMKELVKAAQDVVMEAEKRIEMAGTIHPHEENEEEPKRRGLSPAALEIVKAGLNELRENASFNKCNTSLSKEMRDVFAVQEMSYENAYLFLQAAEAAQPDEEEEE